MAVLSVYGYQFNIPHSSDLFSANHHNSQNTGYFPAFFQHPVNAALPAWAPADLIAETGCRRIGKGCRPGNNSDGIGKAKA
jgi:hypothetical protein